MQELKIVFMGTPTFAVPTLELLHKNYSNIIGVYTQPPKPSGRGYQTLKSPVHIKAEELGLPVFTPKRFKEDTDLVKLAPDLIIVVAYGLLLPKWVLDIPPLGCINIHGSLLPRWRGASPLQHALWYGDKETGITIMKMDEGMDTGPMLSKRSIEITPQTTLKDLHDQLSIIGADLLDATLPLYKEGVCIPQPQPNEGITHAPKITTKDGQLNFNESAVMIDQKVRSLSMAPGTWIQYEDLRLKIHSGIPLYEQHQEKPGTILDDELTVACKEGMYRITTIQKPGGKALDTKTFLRGFPLPKGTQFAYIDKL